MAKVDCGLAVFDEEFQVLSNKQLSGQASADNPTRHSGRSFASMDPERQPEAGYAFERRVARDYDADEVREVGHRAGEGAHRPQRSLIQGGNQGYGKTGSAR